MSIAVGGFLVFAASQVATPGPANMTLMAVGARFGLSGALPFVAGVALGKQFIIWPIGFGLLELSARAPLAFNAMKWLAAAYILWLAWRIANLRLRRREAGEAAPPGFLAGLAVHPLNPKAWALVTAGFTNFVEPGTPALGATAAVAGCLLLTQAILHPLWTWGGERVAATLAGTSAERGLMWTLAALTVLSVAFVLFAGGP